MADDSDQPFAPAELLARRRYPAGPLTGRTCCAWAIEIDIVGLFSAPANGLNSLSSCHGECRTIIEHAWMKPMVSAQYPSRQIDQRCVGCSARHEHARPAARRYWRCSLPAMKVIYAGLMRLRRCRAHRLLANIVRSSANNGWSAPEHHDVGDGKIKSLKARADTLISGNWAVRRVDRRLLITLFRSFCRCASVHGRGRSGYPFRRIL